MTANSMRQNTTNGENDEPSDQPLKNLDNAQASPETSPEVEPEESADEPSIQGSAKKPEQPLPQADLADLREKVERLDGFREGSLSVFRIVGIIITIIAAAGFISVINLFIERRVDHGFEEEVAEFRAAMSENIDAMGSLLQDARLLLDDVGDIATGVADEAATVDAVQLAIAATSTQEAVVELQGNWTVIIASDIELEEALESQRVANSKGFVSTIYKIGEYFATTIGRFPSEESATEALIAIGPEFPTNEYAHDLSFSCPFEWKFSQISFYFCDVAVTDEPGD